MWIEVDFDERVFPDYVWTDFFRSARALRHVTGDVLEKVRITAHAASVDGRPTKTVRVAVTLRVGEEAEVRTFEFASRGRWRIRPLDANEQVPFTLFMPDARHDYERDVLHRSELQIAVLQSHVKAWISERENGHHLGAPGA